MDEPTEAFRMRVGDLVLPLESEEFLFSSASAMDFDVDPIECCWSDVLGVIIGIDDFTPPREYMRVQIMVEGLVGWTYSDYVRILT